MGDEARHALRLRSPAELRVVCQRVVTSLVLATGSLVIGLPLLALLSVLLPVAVLVRRLGARPALPLPPSEVPRLDDVAIGALFLEGGAGLGLNALRNLIRRRVTERRLGDGNLAFPRFSQRVVPTRSGWVLLPDPSFEVENHVILEPGSISTCKHLQSLVQNLESQRLRDDRPPWELRLIPRFGRCGHETVLLFRAHQTVGDGSSLLNLLGGALADDQSSSITVGPREHGTVAVIQAILMGPLLLLANLLLRRGQEKHFPGQPGGIRRLAWTSDIKDRDVRRIKQITRSSVTDVLLSAVAGSLRSHFERSGLPIPPFVRASLPTDIWRGGHAGTPTSLWATVGLPLPIGTEGRIPRLWAIRTGRSALREEAYRALLAARAFCTLLPRGVALWVLSRLWPPAPLAYCGLAGPQGSLALGACPIRRLLVWVGSSTCPPVSFTAVSFGGSFHITVSVDTAVVPSPRTLLADMRLQITKLTNHLGRRQDRPVITKPIVIKKGGIKPSVQEIHQRLEKVQSELHQLARSLELTSAAGRPGLYRRLDGLKSEFSSLLMQLHGEDDDEDEASLPPPRRSSASLAAFLSTARPLTAPPWPSPGPSEHRRCLLNDQQGTSKDFVEDI